MADNLSKMLEEIEPNLRTPNLENLVLALTIDELRFLRKKLIDMSFKTDIISRLPIELQLCVADHVKANDIASFVNVSRDWRRIWLQDKIMNRIVDKWYPGLFDSKATKINNTLEDDLRRETVYLQGLRKDHRRSKGRYRSVLNHGFRLEDENYFNLDETLHSPGAYSEFLVSTPSGRGLGGVLYLYRNGKLAWNPSTRPPPDNSVIILDDFRSKTRKMYKVEGVLMQGLTISLRALGDKFVVGVDSRVAHIWHIETNEHQTVTLPSRIYTCKSEGDRVSFVTDAEAVFIWRSHGPLLEVDMTKPREVFLSLAHPPDPPLHSNYPESNRNIVLTRAHMDVILHPFEAGVYFVVTMSLTSGPHDGVVAVHEYTNHEYLCTRTIDLPQHQTQFQSGQFMGVFSLVDCYPVDTNGSFHLTILVQANHNAAPVSVSVAFNVVKKTFSVNSQIIPLKPEHALNRRDLRRGLRTHYWRSQTTYSLTNLWELGYRLPLITLSPPRNLKRFQGGVLHLAAATVDYGLDPVSGKRISFRFLGLMTAVVRGQGVYQLGDDPRPLPPPLLNNEHMLPENEVPEIELRHPGTCRGICGDDDFLIFIGEDQYTVWRFDADISEEAGGEGEA